MNIFTSVRGAPRTVKKNSSGLALEASQHMRFNAIALLAGALLVGACGGGNSNTDTASTATGDTAGTQATTTPAAGATTAATPATGTGTAMPATGDTVTVQMKAEGTSFVFEPKEVSIKAGQAVKWVMVSGAPHNVAFQNVAADSKAQLDANMPEKMAELTGKMLMNPNENYVVSFAGVKPGKYDYVCQPHAAMNMTGSITVTP